MRKSGNLQCIVQYFNVVLVIIEFLLKICILDTRRFHDFRFFLDNNRVKKNVWFTIIFGAKEQIAYLCVIYRTSLDSVG